MSSYTLADVIDFLGQDVEPRNLSGREKLPVSGISSPEKAAGDQIGFVVSEAYVASLQNTSAIAVLIRGKHAGFSPAVELLCDDPYYQYARLSALFAPFNQWVGISDLSVIGSGCSIGDDVVVAPGVVIGNNCRLGSGVGIGPNSAIGDGVEIGANTELRANVSVMHDVIIGSDCLIQSGTVLGSDGFGYAAHDGRWQKIHQLGTLIIGDRVEIGANCSIDRGAVENTEIHDDVIIDNLVHIAHNCVIGQGTALAGQVGMAGTTIIGKYCTAGGQAGIAGHLELADNVHMTGQAMITSSIETAGVYSSGTGFSSNRQWRRNAVRFSQLDELNKRVKALEKKLNQSN